MLQFAAFYSYLTTARPKISALLQGNLAAPTVDNYAASEDTFTLWQGGSFHKLEEGCQTELYSCRDAVSSLITAALSYTVQKSKTDTSLD